MNKLDRWEMEFSRDYPDQPVLFPNLFYLSWFLIALGVTAFIIYLGWTGRFYG